MNAIEASVLKLLLPELESVSVSEWESVGLPAITAKAKTLAPGSGQEEALILVSALDQIVKFEATRQITP